ncbi:MAG TPA: YihY/virulence factor BrkB family protein, partial [Kofleriaceae bacterium]|nr:YihY/virulence factor BrkB family protein [Kofleriaceae bacterium]
MTFLRRSVSWVRTSNAAVAHWLRAAHDALLGEMPVLAAGTALFAILATVPTLAAVVGVYGLVADAHAIHDHLRGLTTVLPPEVVTFVGDQLEQQATRPGGALGFAVATSIVVAVYSARGAARALIAVLNRAYRVRDRRRAVSRILLSLAMAAATLVGLMLMFGVVVALPGIVALLHLRGYGLVRWFRWPSLMAILYVALLLLYRYGPSPRPITERQLWPGALTATLLLVLVSWGLSQWVERVSDYQLIYGAFGSVVVVLLWFYLSTIALVVGGFVNAELERRAGAPAPDRS